LGNQIAVLAETNGPFAAPKSTQLKLIPGGSNPEAQADWQPIMAEATSLIVAGKFEDAIVHLQLCIGTIEKTEGSNSKSLLEPLSALGLSQMSVGQKGEALKTFDRAQSLAETVCGSNSPELANVLTFKIMLLVDLTRFAEAKSSSEKCISILEKSKPGSLDLAASYTSYATALAYTDAYSEAEKPALKAKAIVEALGAEKTQFGGNLYGILALIYRGEGKSAEAENALKKNLEIIKESSGVEHPDYATAVFNYATFLEDRERYDEAIQLLKQALAIREKVFGKNSERALDCIAQLAGIDGKQGNWLDQEQKNLLVLNASEKNASANRFLLAKAIGSLALTYENQGRYAEAEPLFRKQLLVTQQLFGANSLEAATSEQELAYLLELSGQNNEAEQLYKESLTIRQRLAPDSREVTNSLMFLGTFYRKAGRTSEAEPLLRKCLWIREKLLGANSADVSHAKLALAIVLEVQGKLSEAAPLMEQSVAYFETTKYKTSRDLAMAHLNLANVLFQEKSYSAAETHGRKAAALMKQDTESAGSAYRERNFAAAKSFQRAGLQIMTSNANSGKSHDDLPTLASTLMRDGNSKKNQDTSLLDTLVKTTEKLNNASNENPASLMVAYTQLATVLESNLMLGAFDYESKAVASLKNLLNSDSTYNAALAELKFADKAAVESAVTNVSMQLMYLCAMVPNSRKSLECARLSRQLVIKSNIAAADKVHMLVAAGDLLLDLGDYDEGRKTIDTAIAICEEKKAEVPEPLLARALLALATLELSIANYDPAERIIDKAEKLQVDDKLLAQISALSSKCSLISAIQSKVRPIPNSVLTAAERTIAISKKAFGEQSQEVVAPTLNLAYCNKLSGKLNLSIIELEQLLTGVKDDKYGNSKLARGTVANQLGEYKFEAGDVENSKPLFYQAINLHKSDNTPEAVLALVDDYAWLALCYKRLGDNVMARRAASDSAAALNHYIETTIPQLSFGQQCAFLQPLQNKSALLIGSCASPEDYQSMYSYIFRWKGLLIQTIAQQASMMRIAALHPEFKQQLDNTAGKLAQLERLSQQGAKADDVQKATLEYDAAVDNLSHLTAMSLNDPLKGIGFLDFTKQLAPDEAFVDMCTYMPSEVGKKAELHYAAFVIGKDIKTDSGSVGTGARLRVDPQGKVVVDAVVENSPAARANLPVHSILLTVDGQKIDGLDFNQVIAKIRGPENTSVSLTTALNGLERTTKMTRERVWLKTQLVFVDLGPVKDDDAQIINWSRLVTNPGGNPSNLLAARSAGLNLGDNNNVKGIGNFDERTKTLEQSFWTPIDKVLPADCKNVWMCSENELAKMPWSLLANRNICDIDSPREFIALKNRKTVPASTENLLVAGGVKFTDPAFPDLPGTKEEAIAICDEAPKSFTVLKLLDAEPTKARMQESLPRMSMVHLATHGYFDEGGSAQTASAIGDANDASTTIKFRSGSSFSIVAVSPLMRSGIVLANDTNDGSQKGQARLSAQDIVNMDLSKCKLVTLSACETARGAEYTGQGVIGLRSALIGAGADCLLLSLWKVDDDATKFLMEQFYKEYWNASVKRSPYEALQLAKKAVKNEPKWNHPYYWAAWDLVGHGR